VIQLTILHINDLHGRVEQLARIASLVRAIRSAVLAAGGYCLFLDAGDVEDTALLESSLTKGSAMQAILRGAGCDWAALGNAIPMRYGPQAVADLGKYFGRPLLCANMLDPHGQLLAGLQPYALETIGGLKIGLIGLTAPNEAYQTFFQLDVPEPLEVLPGLVERVRLEGAKTVILVSHLGSAVDQKVAESLRGINVIVGGHDHVKISPPQVVNDTIIVQAGDFGQYLGRLDLILDSETGSVAQHTGELIPVEEDVPGDPAAQAAVEAQHARVERMMQNQIGCLNDPVELSVEQECSAGNLLADALLERMEATQVALVLAGHWTNGLEAGPLTQGRLYAANRSTANPARARLSGLQIEQFLAEALKLENARRSLHALRGGAVGMPHVAGLRVRHDPEKLEKLEKLEVWVGDEPLQPEQIYLVAATDMEFADFIGYLPLPMREIEFEVPTIMPEVLEDYIARHSPLDRPAGGRIAPHSQVQGTGSSSSSTAGRSISCDAPAP
jgi:2',3'-cyclic-nucleotide 2'-phosphodiesterase (5'-nucleotidase family)